MPDLLDNYGSFLVDMHITEDNDSFLGKLTPESHVAAMKKCRGDSVIVSAACVNSNYYYTRGMQCIMRRIVVSLKHLLRPENP